MTYSYTQISQYLTCPRRYRHRYLDGWKEKDTRAAMLFGRAFERALGALFRREDPGAVLFAEWSGCQSQELHYSNRDSWDRMLRQGITLLTRFCQDNRVQVCQPRRNLQVKFTRPVAGNDFVAYIDAIGKLDGMRCLLEWKTSSARYPEEPEGLLALDPQLVCYSWMTGIAEVAQVVLSERAWLRFNTCAPPSPTNSARSSATWSRAQSGASSRRTFSRTVASAFQNPCSSCPYVGLCLGKQQMIDAALVRRPGADSLGWLDELDY
jgi:hypothetical protein